MVSASDAESFVEDGVVLLRGAVEDRWLQDLALAVAYNQANPSDWAYGFSTDGELAGFWSDYATWQNVAEYRRVVFESGLAEMARTLMRSDESRFFHEHALVKESGTSLRTPWHHDQPYYCVDGDQNVSFWIPLDPIAASSGLRFIAGSHRWNRWFIPRRFADHVAYVQPQGRYELIPDFDAELGKHRVLSWDVEPGDLLAFHFRTVHDGAGNSLGRRRRAVSLRWLGEDAVFADRPWETSPPFDQGDLEYGGPMEDRRFPVVA